LIRTHHSIRITALALGAALVFAACGGDDNTTDSTDAGGGDSAVPTCVNFNDLYALTGPESEGVDNWADAQTLAAELGSTSEFSDLDLSITAPGEESGTYGSFVEIALKEIGEARAESGDITEDQVETTRKDYSSSADDNVIIEGVAGTEGSLGWVGYAFADLNKDKVRLLEVDGGDGCVAPNPTTIADGSYPLSRPLFIYVNKAKATDNAAVAAFVDFYLSEQGLEAVEEEDYITLDDAAWASSGETWAAEGFSSEGDLSGEIVVSGSSTVEPISANIGERFFAENGDVSVSVTGPGTSDGIEQFCAGEIDIADASRAMKDEEITACADAGIEYVELQVAIDGLSVITQL
jgi:ABC-type phosphate transport system substrate-binding protein